jgi:putative endonuclease
MKSHILYIITDSNRQFLNVDITSDFTRTVNEIKSSSNVFFPNGPHLTRIVYMEKFESREQAKKRQLELNQFTRMQKEKLIRRHNTNWNNLCPSCNSASQKKSVAYTS